MTEPDTAWDEGHPLGAEETWPGWEGADHPPGPDEWADDPHYPDCLETTEVSDYGWDNAEEDPPGEPEDGT